MEFLKMNKESKFCMAETENGYILYVVDSFRNKSMSIGIYHNSKNNKHSFRCNSFKKRGVFEFKETVVIDGLPIHLFEKVGKTITYNSK